MERRKIESGPSYAGRDSRVKSSIKRFVMAWVTIGLSVGVLSAQRIETVILLPDSFSGIREPDQVVLNTGNNLVYIASRGDSSVVALDGISNRKSGRFTLPGDAGPMCYARAENKLYCSVSWSDRVEVIDAASGRELATIPVGSWPTVICYNPTAHKVYCAIPYEQSVAIIDAGTDQVRAFVQLLGEPRVICCNPVGNKVYVADSDSGFVWVINGAGDTLREMDLCHDDSERHHLQSDQQQGLLYRRGLLVRGDYRCRRRHPDRLGQPLQQRVPAVSGFAR